MSDVNSLFYKYSLLDIKLELPSFNENIHLSTKQLDFNANCLLLNYSKFCKHADMVAYEFSTLTLHQGFPKWAISPPGGRF